MCAAERLHPTKPSHGKQGLGTAARHYGWEDVGHRSLSVERCMILYDTVLLSAYITSCVTLLIYLKYGVASVIAIIPDTSVVSENIFQFKSSHGYQGTTSLPPRMLVRQTKGPRRWRYHQILQTHRLLVRLTPEIRTRLLAMQTQMKNQMC